MKNSISILLVGLMALNLSACFFNQKTSPASGGENPQSSASSKSDISALSKPICGAKSFCTVFVTSTSLKGDLSVLNQNSISDKPTFANAIAAADSICANDANKPAGGSTYKAMLVDGTNRVACSTADCSGGAAEQVDWIFHKLMEYRQADGTTIVGTSDSKALLRFSNNPAVSGVAIYWTGLNNDWTVSADNCSGWTSTNGNGSYGVSAKDVDSWSSGAHECNGASGNLICVEQ